jgi:hypothetical protein
MASRTVETQRIQRNESSYHGLEKAKLHWLAEKQELVPAVAVETAMYALV